MRTKVFEPLGMTTTTFDFAKAVATKYGIPVVHHGGDLAGYHSDMIWLPDHGVGAVILRS
jgi:CubicO group peptidase (beta-lactamase class C family)